MAQPRRSQPRELIHAYEQLLEAVSLLPEGEPSPKTVVRIEVASLSLPTPTTSTLGGTFMLAGAETISFTATPRGWRASLLVQFDDFEIVPGLKDDMEGALNAEVTLGAFDGTVTRAIVVVPYKDGATARAQEAPTPRKPNAAEEAWARMEAIVGPSQKLTALIEQMSAPTKLLDGVLAAQKLVEGALAGSATIEGALRAQKFVEGAMAGSALMSQVTEAAKAAQTYSIDIDIGQGAVAAVTAKMNLAHPPIIDAVEKFAAFSRPTSALEEVMAATRAFQEPSAVVQAATSMRDLHRALNPLAEIQETFNALRFNPLKEIQESFRALRHNPLREIQEALRESISPRELRESISPPRLHRRLNPKPIEDAKTRNETAKKKPPERKPKPTAT